MSRKRMSIPKDVQSAQQRVNGMKSVDERLDLGNGVTVETFTAAIKGVTDEIAEYNMMLADLDAKANLIDSKIGLMKDFAKRALTGAEYKYGPDSNEYERIGGIRTSDRKKPGRRKAGTGGEVK
ncbi:MAG: hypothetical protein JSS81_05520 [Acidobacteria bacterium]|nr:hypothetical protein [Acidobacteriota bacterium]